MRTASAFYISSHPKIDGFAFATFQTKSTPGKTNRPASLRVSATELESPRYRLRIDTATGGIASLIDKSAGKELLVNGTGHTIGQTVFFDGKEHQLANVKIGS